MQYPSLIMWQVLETKNVLTNVKIFVSNFCRYFNCF